MSVTAEVRRTLVKSPPELWSELSDAESLARHLGELGEIRIVRVEPERKVEWAAENTTGTVSIQPSGWGTKVTLSVTRELLMSAPAPLATDGDDTLAQAAETGPQPAPVEPKTAAEANRDALNPAADALPTSEPETEPTPEIEPEAAVNLEPEQATTEPIEPQTATKPAQRRGFFARMFGRRRREQTAPEPIASADLSSADSPNEPETSVELAVQAPHAFAAASEALAHEEVKSRIFEIPTGPSVEAGVNSPADTPEPQETRAPNRTEAGADITAELMAAEEVAAEEVAAEEVTAVLAAVLDRLGAAHHRPFSRS